MSSFQDLRSQARLTLSEASEFLGLELESVLAYERGERSPAAREIQALRGLTLAYASEAHAKISQKQAQHASDASVTAANSQSGVHQESNFAKSRNLAKMPADNTGLPHPIPYQGSKRSLAPLIAPFVPSSVETWFEPFAGSAAMTLWAARQGIARHYIIGDSLEPIANLWRAIIAQPVKTAGRYEEIWKGQHQGQFDYFNRVRARYNKEKDPIDLLYLICRCVKNAVRFNRNGDFTQSVDKRRLGMRPDKMHAAITGASFLLKGRIEVRIGDWLKTVSDATVADFLYMDPPYSGTSIGRDKRYAHQMDSDRLVDGLRLLRARNVRFALSYDGMTGTKEYGPPLPSDLGMTRHLLHAGKSSQATLSGRREDTIESLYVSPELAAPNNDVIRRIPAQDSLDF